MEQVNDLKLIKKHYGENMMHLCRELFPTILETSGLLFSLLDSKFAYSKFLYDDIVNNSLKDNFKNFIYGLIDVEKEEVIVEENPFELLKKAGYNLFECQTEEEIQSFKRYYEPNERICTFNGNRLSICHVFFAVKENVDEIKREDFSDPQRQDAYGTSVISIQFTKGEVNTLSIKNRYNHTVNQPDATFSNNLENIIPGLTYSFTNHYNLNINQNDSKDLELPGYVLANDGKFYKYNYEINNIYYCPDNIIIDRFGVKKDYQEKEKYILADYFLIDLVKKRIDFYDKSIDDSFTKEFYNIDKIDIIRDKQTGNRIINITPLEGSVIVIKIDKFNRIIGYKNNNIKYINPCFLFYNTALKEIEMNELMEVSSYYLYNNIGLEKISFPKLMFIGNYFLEKNYKLLEADLPSLEVAGHQCLKSARLLNKINAPKLRAVGNDWLYSNVALDNISYESLENVGHHFMYCNSRSKIINMPKLFEVGSDFCCYSRCSELYAPNLESIGDNFLYFNNSLITLKLEKLKKMGFDCLWSNSVIEEVYLPSLLRSSPGFLGNRYLVPKGK